MLVGTHEGLYRVPREPFESAERLLDGRINDLWRGDSWYAATDSGLFRSADGDQWQRQSVSGSAVAVTGDGDRVFVGTYPARVFLRDETGDWKEAEQFRASADTARWADQSPRSDGSQVRSIAVDSTGRIAAGVEVGGTLVSEDGGVTWTDRSEGLHDDVHELHSVGAGEFVAATGNGLYRTTNAGESWQRLDTSFHDFWYNYHRTVTTHDGGLFTAAAGWGPETGAGAVFSYDDDSVDRVESPVETGFLVGCAVAPEGLYAVTLDCADGFGQSRPAEVCRYDGEWTTLGTVPAGGRCLALG